MGTDIHMFAEVRTEARWRKVGAIWPYAYYRPEEPTRRWNGHDFEDVPPDEMEAALANPSELLNPPRTDRPFECRNYDVFAMLASVRNAKGFAGVETGEPFIPFSGARGIPDDADDVTVARLEEEADHSFSYASLAELEGYFAALGERVRTRWGVIPARSREQEFFEEDNYEAMQREGRHSPKSWAAEVSGLHVLVVGAAEYERLREAGGLVDGKEYYVRVTWQETYTESARLFVTETLPRLRGLMPPGGDAGDVRIVFGFDS